MSKRKRWVLVVILLLIFVATLIKHWFNSVWDASHARFAQPQSISVEDARTKGVLVAELTIEPRVTANGDKQYEFQEAWLEAAYRPRHFLIWFSYMGRAEWNHLCVRPKTDWYQETYSYSLWPEYGPTYRRESAGLTHTAGNVAPELHFKKVPSDLEDLRLIVHAYTYEEGQDLTIGTVTLTRQE